MTPRDRDRYINEHIRRFGCQPTALPSTAYLDCRTTAYIGTASAGWYGSAFEVQPYHEPDPELGTCAYCGRDREKSQKSCDGCGAGKTIKSREVVSQFDGTGAVGWI
jgi:hypothetical protein